MRHKLRQAACAVAGWTGHVRGNARWASGALIRPGRGPIQRSPLLSPSEWSRSAFSIAAATAGVALRAESALTEAESGQDAHCLRQPLSRQRAKVPDVIRD